MNKSTSESAFVTLGVDLAKNIFQLHGVDAAGQVVMQRVVTASQIAAASAASFFCRRT